MKGRGYIEVRYMETLSSKVTSKGQVVIPKRLRKKYGILPVTVIQWIEKGNGILMVPESEDPIKAARGMFQGTGLLNAFKGKKVRKAKGE